jgi:xanthine dehydrogenase accessory factor
MTELVGHLHRLNEARSPYVLVTLTSIRGSAPQIVGSKMLVSASGLIWGTVGGGKIEAHCIRHAQHLLSCLASAESRTWNLQTEIGMTCGGEVGFFFDPVLFGTWHVSIFGAGHVSQELCRVLQTWSCHVSVFDTRKEWLAKLPRSSNIAMKLSSDLAGEVSALPAKAFVLSMTQGHAVDVPILRAALSRVDELSFVGVIGSKQKASRIKKELRELGVPSATIARLACPIGLDIGDNTPPEIAISIASQLLALRDGVDVQIVKRSGCLVAAGPDR